MNKQALLNAVEQTCMKTEVPFFEIGDTVDVHTKILEGNKERIQVFTGTVIARSGGGSREMFTVRRIVAGEGVERKFPLHSPRIEKIEVKPKDRQNNKCRIWLDGTQRGRESFSGNDQPHGKRLARKRLPTPSALARHLFICRS
jgi:large subunit ribosomal protein L19